MLFVLRGFSEATGCRVFAFEGIAADRTRAAFTVKADLALARRYGIRLQELPLLCRGVLDRRYEDLQTRAFNYSEEEMSLYAKDCAAVKQRKPPRRPAAGTVGSAWRVSPQLSGPGPR